MRWRFADLNMEQELQQRNAIHAKIDAWWQEFGKQTENIKALFSRKAQWDLPAWMERHLQAIHSRLMWEFGPAVRCNGHRLVITPESAHHLRPLVQTILERAPDLRGWEFYEYRLAENLEQTQQAVEGRSGRSIADFGVRATIGQDQRIDLTYSSPTITNQNDDDARNAAFVATETLLGEECLDKWIGGIAVEPMQRNKGITGWFQRSKKHHNYLPLDRLAETVQALIGSMREQLSPSPHCDWIEQAEWTMWKLKPEEAEDYPGQQDLFVGKSGNPRLWKAAHGKGLFHSERFSRCDETFCYLKLDGSQGLDEEHFADKGEIEDALDAVLRPDKLGCFFGGGTGIRYSYVDLALGDVDKGIEAVRRRLQAGNVPKRSWIQFFDSHWAAEWVGIYDDSPPPPMALDGV